MIFIKADKDDISSLVEMRISYLNEDYGTLETSTEQKIRAILPAYFEKHLNLDLFAYVAKEDRRMLAAAFLLVVEKPANPSFITGKTGTILNVFTHKNYRRKGIAGQLLNLMLNDARTLGIDLIELKATDEGYNLYKSLGFQDSCSKYKNMKYIVE